MNTNLYTKIYGKTDKKYVGKREVKNRAYSLQIGGPDLLGITWSNPRISMLECQRPLTVG